MDTVYVTLVWAPILMVGGLGTFCFSYQQTRIASWAIPAMLLIIEMASLMAASSDNPLRDILWDQIKLLALITSPFLVLHISLEVLEAFRKKKPKPVPA